MTRHRLAVLAASGLVALSLLPFNPGRVEAGTGAPKVVMIEIRNFVFQPESVTVHPGDTVEWKNEDDVPHTATGDTPKPGFDSGVIQSGAAWRYEVQEKGKYNYICTIHPYMKGTLIVQ